MTMRTTSPLVCQCGHTGQMHLSENDSPYSSLWERYRAEGFDGDEVVITATNAQTNVLEEMKLKCPSCGEVGKVTHAKGA